MGNQHHEKFQWDKTFTVLERNFNDHTLILEKINGGQQYIGRELISTDKKQSQEIKRLIKLKYHNNNPFLTKLEEVYSNNEDAYCSPEQKIYLVFLKPKQTLRHEILARKFANQPFTEEQADIILESGAKGIRALRQINHPHNNISTSSIFIDKDRKIIVGDPWITPPVYNHGINQNVFACPSPEKILLQNDQIFSICPYQSDLFSLGTVVLEALNYEHMDILYEKGFRKLIQSRVKEKLSKIKNDQLRYKLSIILSHDPQNRDQIYKFYRPSASSVSQVKNKIINKQQNGETINKGSPIALLSKQMLSYDRNPNNNTIYEEKYKMQRKKGLPEILPNNNNIKKETENRVNGYKVGYNEPLKWANNNYGGNNLESKNLHHNTNFNYGQYRINGTPTITNTTVPNTTPIVTFGNYAGNQNLYSNPLNKAGTITSNFNYMPSTYNTSAPNLIPTTTTNAYTTFKPQIFPVLNTTSNRASNNVIQTSMKSDANNNFQPVLINKSEDFVKTSANIRYIDVHGVDLNNQKLSTQNINTENLAHTGNYTIKPNAFETLTKTQVYLPLGEMHNEQGNEHKELAINISQNQENAKISPPRGTPQRKPNRKYNSTIKEEPDQYSYSGSRDGDDEYQYVIQTYEAGRYEGQKKNSMRNGFGKFYYKEGSVYEGNWKDNLMHGKGNLYYSDGKIAYEGDWRMDEFHGSGKVYNQEQLQLKGPYDYTDFGDVNDYWSSYEGELNSDRRHGKGKIKLSNGQIFVGNFVADTVEGEGKFYTVSGQIIQGKWRNNKLVKKG